MSKQTRPTLRVQASKPIPPTGEIDAMPPHVRRLIKQARSVYAATHPGRALRVILYSVPASN